MKIKEKIYFGLLILLYFIVRISYWVTHDETPFSDIADYVRIGQQVVENWDFAHFHPFWLSYKPPVLPLFLAFYFKLRGSFNLDFWPLFQTVFHFSSLLFLLFEIRRVNKCLLVPGLYLFVFALSKSSVFWSFKPSTEYISEAFILSLSAFTLYTLRKKTVLNFFVLGLLTMTSILLRPQFIPFLGIAIPMAFLIKAKPKEKIKMATAILLGAFLTWLPWGVRTYQLYGTPIFTSTQGPYSFLWELGKVNYTSPMNEIITTDVSELQMTAESRFKNDFEAMTFANSVAKGWLKANFPTYLSLIPFRIWNSISDKSEALTHLPRNDLFPNYADWILLNKDSFFVVSGIFGLILSLYFTPVLWPLFAIPMVQWLMGTAFLSYPRIIDPALPFFYAGNYVFFTFIRDFVRRKRHNPPKEANSLLQKFSKSI